MPRDAPRASAAPVRGHHLPLCVRRRQQWLPQPILPVVVPVRRPQHHKDRLPVGACGSLANCFRFTVRQRSNSTSRRLTVNTEEKTPPASVPPIHAKGVASRFARTSARFTFACPSSMLATTTLMSPTSCSRGAADNSVTPVARTGNNLGSTGPCTVSPKKHLRQALRLRLPRPTASTARAAPPPRRPRPRARGQRPPPHLRWGH